MSSTEEATPHKESDKAEAVIFVFDFEKISFYDGKI